MTLSTLLATLLMGAGLAHAATVSYDAKPIACKGIQPPKVPGASIVSFSAQEQYNVSGIYVDESIPKIDFMDGLDICNVEVTLTHPGMGDRTGFQIWLPLKGWNNRFLATGGGGYIAGHRGVQGLGLSVKNGFAGGITDGGNISDAGGFLLPDMITSPGQINMNRLTNFASKSLHELAVIGKAVAKSFYGRAPSHSYWHGCSQGGRQGYMLAQKYPGDFDGILANAPAIDISRLLVGAGWGEFTMRRLNHTVSTCVFNAFYRAAVKACDGIDGVKDDIISNPDSCHFKPFDIVGQTVDCKPGLTAISSKDAEVVKVIMGGAKSPSGTQLWQPYSWGMNFSSVAPVDRNFSELWNRWVSIMVNKNPSFDKSNYKTLEQFAKFMKMSVAEYDSVIGTTNADLSAFRDQGGKLLTWHGLADDIIPKDNTIKYRKAIEAKMGGNQLVNEFYRVFFPAGISHCFGGNGAFPGDALDSLVQWVEKGKAPEKLHGKTRPFSGTPAERIICPYPLVARYDGKGDDTKASSYTCAKHFAAEV
ncbi:feruloyl esterase B [Dactylonectria macrodidyma]|uniref:Carboxylic ester hydrolase n=1 Tax=Dactylonectria macrodidyma TaxID=307937 RepID=A0A9P9CXD8_9HYPO|nr:feruloyl esterase B [Dactylonectria macrodidyma]